MVLPWRRKRRPRVPDTTAAAQAALAQSQSEARRVQRAWPRVHQVADSLARERELNHFSSRFAVAFGHDTDT